jgi:hypothetical protein
MIIKRGKVEGRGACWCLVLGLLGDTFLKGMVHLQSFCVVLEGWVFNKLGKGTKGGSFCCLVLGVFWGNFVWGMKHWKKIV